MIPWNRKHSLKGHEQAKRDVGFPTEIARGLVIQYPSFLQARNRFQNSSLKKSLFHNFYD